MKDSKTIINRVAQEIYLSKKESQTEAGPTSPPVSGDLIDAINQIFGLFSINYHNQYYKAFCDEKTESQAKKLWLEILKTIPPETLLLAAKEAIKSSTYLPTINQILTYCEAAKGLNLPIAHEAYIEACRAGKPRRNVNWSHPAVYYAGQKADWYFLETSSELSKEENSKRMEKMRADLGI